MTDAAPPTVLVPAGVPLEEAATWVGQACWAELRLHEVLTGWLAVEVDDGWSVRFWALRAEAAARAEAWHRRLPELQEFPRAGFVAASGTAAEAVFDGLASLDGPADAVARVAALASVLGALRAGYEERSTVAVGPADGPTAVTLDAAADALGATVDQLPTTAAAADPAWARARLP